ncbi:MAG TPA: hypothetical protein VKA07_12255 [Candidatus Sulfotelmatobacter sp.]|nr:hypothetical protein [Candidatus Sulfotelmatobacter sp.]
MGRTLLSAAFDLGLDVDPVFEVDLGLDVDPVFEVAPVLEVDLGLEVDPGSEVAPVPASAPPSVRALPDREWNKEAKRRIE